jgi:hypothetical protein
MILIDPKDITYYLLQIFMEKSASKATISHCTAGNLGAAKWDENQLSLTELIELLCYPEN